MEDFSFQGKVYLAENVGGKPQAMRWVGDAKLKVQFNSSEESRKESYSGTRRTSATMQKDIEAKFSMSFFKGSAENFAIGLGGSITTIASGSATGEPLPTGLAAGDLVALDNPDISSLSIEDSAATPEPLVLGTHYAISDPVGAIVEILDPAALTQPFAADYDFGEGKSIAMMSQRPAVRYLIMVAENTVDGANERVRLELYRAKFNYAKELDMHADSLSGLDCDGTLLLDSNNEVDPVLGAYGRWRMLGAA